MSNPLSYPHYPLKKAYFIEKKLPLYKNVCFVKIDENTFMGEKVHKKLLTIYNYRQNSVLSDKR